MKKNPFKVLEDAKDKDVNTLDDTVFDTDTGYDELMRDEIIEIAELIIQQKYEKLEELQYKLHNLEVIYSCTEGYKKKDLQEKYDQMKCDVTFFEMKIEGYQERINFPSREKELYEFVMNQDYWKLR